MTHHHSTTTHIARFFYPSAACANPQSQPLGTIAEAGYYASLSMEEQKEYRIRRRAYDLYLKGGKDPLANWLQAEKEDEKLNGR